MLNKYKNKIIIFLLGFLVYFICGLILTYYLDTAKFWNVLFDLDTPRVLGDLTIRNYNHYRVAVHPLFVIVFQPIVRILDLLINNFNITIVLIQSIISAISLVLVNICVNKITKNKNLSILLTTLFGCSFYQIIFSSAVETYIYAQVFLLLLWTFAIVKCDKEFNYYDYIIITLLGIGSLAVTITNFFQYLIVLFFLIFQNKKIEKRFLTSVIIVFLVVAISVLLAEIQNIVWPTAPNFFTKNIQDLFLNTSEETTYINTGLSFKSLMNVLNANFAYAFNFFNLYIPAKGVYITFESSNISNFISIAFAIIFFYLNLKYMIKNKFNINKNKIYYALVLAYIFNFALHLLYGNSIAYIYGCHFNFIVVLLLAYTLKDELKNIKLLNNKKIVYFIIGIIALLCFRGTFIMFNKLFPLYNPINNFRLLPMCIIMISSITLICLALKNNKIKLILSIICFLLILLFYLPLNKKENICDESCDQFSLYQEKFDKYAYQLKDMRNTYNVKSYRDRDSDIGIYFFGMADEFKILYKDGKLINIKTKETLFETDYIKQLIVPNEYTVLLMDKNNNIYKIYENEKGIYLEKNSEITTIMKRNKKINLPEFDNQKYSEILKVLHQEILFNIDGSVPKPNIFGYTTAWYRDAMLGTKVLEYTNNTDILLPWINSVDSIYDYSRSKDIEETDNLGELLYIIGATGSSRSDLVEKIINEINAIKTEEGYIKGNIDGFIQAYYPTVLALYGADKVGIELELNVPTIDDGYAKLTWYSDYRIASNQVTVSEFYPYINWGFYHYAPYETLYILDEIYPLSYEGGDTSTPGKVEKECFVSDYYCNQQLYLSHMWHASEMFLFLIEATR